MRATEVLGRADAVMYDRLSVASLLMGMTPPDAEWINVGKAPGHATMSQPDINAMLIEKGRAGLEVVRLKGGDPFVFARGGEEAQALVAAGVPFEVVPGISTAIAVPAYAGIPVTYRGLATSFTVVTGHEDPWAATETDWEAVARVGGTIVVLMGVATRAAIAERLVAGGLDPATPVVATQWGTRPEQRTVRTTLAGLGAATVDAPAVIVIGAVAGLELPWFELRPLLGRQVVVTRESERVAPLVAKLRDCGASVVEVPTVETATASDGGAGLRAALGRLGRYDWVVCTSTRSVDAVFAAVRDARQLAGAAFAAVGPATAAALKRQGIDPELVGDGGADELVAAFPAGPGQVLFPASAGARPDLSSGLAAHGWSVDVVEAYRTVPARPPATALDAAASADAVTFTSPSTVNAFVGAMADRHVPPLAVCIGPTTADAAAATRQFDRTVAAEQPTIDALVRAMVDAVVH